MAPLVRSADIYETSHQRCKGHMKSLPMTKIIPSKNIGKQLRGLTKRDMVNLPVVFHSQVFKLPPYIRYALNVTATEV